MNSITIDDLREHGLENLDVYVNENLVATLDKEGNKYVLNYLPETNKDQFVSLSLPVRAESWVSTGKLFPFFEMNLPEGYRRDVIAETFGKAMLSEEMSLLAIAGSDTIGRVRVVPAGFDLHWKNECIVDVEQQIESPDLDSFFKQAFNEYASQGVSGVQPKVLVTNSRVTLRSDKWILKHDGADNQWLSANEYLSMEAAKNCGLDVPECRLSNDGSSLFVKRFDLGGYGFEDFCSLMGLPPHQKYSGSVERMVLVALSFVTNRTKTREAILRAIIFNTCIGNADAHLKNFGLIFKDGNIELSPFYDLVSTCAFDKFKNDIPSLSIGGKKEWAIGKAFYTLAKDQFIPKTTVEKMISEVISGIEATKPEILSMIKKYPKLREHAKSIILLWDKGQKRIAGKKYVDDSAELLTSIGFSAPKSTKVKKNNPYAGGVMKGEKN